MSDMGQGLKYTFYIYNLNLQTYIFTLKSLQMDLNKLLAIKNYEASISFISQAQGKKCMLYKIIHSSFPVYTTADSQQKQRRCACIIIPPATTTQIRYIFQDTSKKLQRRLRVGAVRLGCPNIFFSSVPSQALA